MNSKVEFESGAFGVKAVLKNTWDDSLFELFLQKEVKELELNTSKGWSGENLNFLKFLQPLTSLIIIDLKIKFIDPVHYLINLKKLELITYSSTIINFHSFPQLSEVSFEWIKGSESLFEIENIKKLFINNFRGKSSSVLCNLVNLEYLGLLNAPIDNLKGLRNLTSLRFLRLGNLKKINSLEGLENLLDLEELEIERCSEIKNINEVFSLKKLIVFMLLDLGKIESLKGIENLSKLESFFFYGSTNILDGDLSPMFKLPKLSKTSFQNRRHYTHTREEIQIMH